MELARPEKQKFHSKEISYIFPKKVLKFWDDC